MRPRSSAGKQAFFCVVVYRHTPADRRRRVLCKNLRDEAGQTYFTPVRPTVHAYFYEGRIAQSHFRQHLFMFLCNIDIFIITQLYVFVNTVLTVFYRCLNFSDPEERRADDSRVVTQLCDTYVGKLYKTALLYHYNLFLSTTK